MSQSGLQSLTFLFYRNLSFGAPQSIINVPEPVVQPPPKLVVAQNQTKEIKPVDEVQEAESGQLPGTSYTISNEKTTKKTTVTQEVTRREVRSPVKVSLIKKFGV